jgi:predicted nucleic-acid-binding protein
MRAVDTNVLVRLIARDDPEEVHAAEDFASKGAWISHVVLVETIWVLDSVYERSNEQLATVVDMLLNHKELTLQDSEVVAAALAGYRKRPSVGFSDHLLREVAFKAGHLPVGTFDRELAKLSDVERLPASRREPR